MKYESVLLVDISNSRTKFCLWLNDVIGEELHILPTSQITESSVRACISGWRFTSVLVSSVVPEAAEVIRKVFREHSLRFVSASDSVTVDFSGYMGRRTLGADRVANVLGAAAKGRFPIVAIDLGTAITFDVITRGDNNDKPVFRGGVIAPGLALFRDYLSTRAAQLPGVTLPSDADFPPIGENTTHAMLSGIRYGACGMIREIISSISLSLEAAPYVVATGGDADWTAARLPEIHEVDRILTFRGIASLIKTES